MVIREESRRRYRHGWRCLRGAAALVAAGMLSAAAWGQPADQKDATATGTTTTNNTNRDDAEWRQRMEQRMESLERENASLRKEVGDVRQTQQEVIQDATSRSSIGAAAGGWGLNRRPVETTPPDFDTHKYAAEGDFPGSITIPGTNVSIQIGGFVQLDAITDSHHIGSEDSFIVSSIPTHNQGAGQTNFSIRQTRLFVKTSTPTDLGPLVTFVEGDFFGPDGTDFRIRHAYGSIGDRHQFLAGQTWSTFMDASVYPAIFDYQGPNGMVLVRQPMVRYQQKFGDDIHWQIALEDPNPDLSSVPQHVGHSTAQLPDVASNVRWSPAWGHLQLAAVLRQLTFDPDAGHRKNGLGFGLNFTGQINVLKPVAEGKQDNILFEITAGEGIANYFNDTSGLGADAFVKDSGSLSELGIWGGFIAYQHYWCKKWASTAGYSYLHLNNSSQQPAGAYRSGHYVVANIMWYPADRIWMGFEGLYGVREDHDGSHGDDARVSFSVQYRF